MQQEQFVFFCKKNEPNGYLSNWYAAPFTLDGVTFKTTEHHMMWSKAILMGDKEVAERVLRATSPAEVKALGRKVKNFDPKLWDAKKFQVVLDGNVAKFDAHPKLAAKLIATGDRILVEAADYDQIYGIGLAASDPRAWDQATWRGENLLGKILMEVRRRLQ